MSRPGLKSSEALALELAKYKRLLAILVLKHGGELRVTEAEIVQPVTMGYVYDKDQATFIVTAIPGTSKDGK